MALWNRRRRREISMSDLVNYGAPNGPFDGRSINIDAAAEDLEVPKSTIRKIISTTRAAFSNTVVRAFTGRTAADTATGASPRGMLQAAFGKGPRGGAVNTKEAAKTLGVSPQTVRRWSAGTQQPSPEHLDAIKGAARKATGTKPGRKDIADEYRKTTTVKRPRKIWVDGYQGPGPEYMRDRRIQFDVSDNDLDAMLRAYEDGGADGFRDWLTGQADSAYLADWEFGTIDEFGLE